MTEVASRSWRTANRLTAWDVFYATDIAIACGISYALITHLLVRFVEHNDTLLGGMWAVVATVFVFRETSDSSFSAGLARLIATCVSFAICLAYLLTFPFTGVGLAAAIGVGTIAMTLLGREQDIVTAGITTAVVMVAAGMGPEHEAWRQPILRLIDTVVGIAVGVGCKWCASCIFYHTVGERAR